MTLLAGCGSPDDPIGKAEKKDIDPPGVADIKAIVERVAPKLVNLGDR
jgi:hypothetical protein